MTLDVDGSLLVCEQGSHAEHARISRLDPETAHFAALWGSAIVTLPKLEAAPPVTQWGKKEVAIDLFHHAVYVAAAGAAYELLDRA